MIQKLPVKHLGGWQPPANQFFQRYARPGQHPLCKVPPKDVETEDPQVREQEVALQDIGKVLTEFILVLSFQGVIETADCYAPQKAVQHGYLWELLSDAIGDKLRDGKAISSDMVHIVIDVPDVAVHREIEDWYAEYIGYFVGDFTFLSGEADIHNSFNGRVGLQ